MKKRARTSEEKIAKKNLLLDTAKGLFKELGFRGTTVEIITNNAGLSTGTFYLYFKSKIDIYRELNIIAVDILYSIIKEELDNEANDVKTKIRLVLKAYLRFYHEENDYYYIMSILHLGQRDFFYDFFKADYLYKRANDLLLEIKAIFDDGVKSGEMREVDTLKLSLSFWGIIEGVLLLDVTRNATIINAEINDMAEFTMDQFFRGIMN